MKLSEIDHSLPFFIPQFIKHTLEAVCKAETGYIFLQNGVFSGAFFQVVIRDAGIEVMDVVETNIACQPVKGFRDIVKSTASDRSQQMIPVLFPLFICFFVLMLNIEKPECDYSEKKQIQPLHNQKCFPSNQKSQGRIYRNQCKIVVKL